MLTTEIAPGSVIDSCRPFDYTCYHETGENEANAVSWNWSLQSGGATSSITIGTAETKVYVVRSTVPPPASITMIVSPS